jgi:prepilin signal peptidase PulO-like enzyme (type II secretory pathway)
MQSYAWAVYGLQALWIVFVFAWGACAGSLINVLVYRLPLGLDVIWTPSRCPACGTKLTWRENIPVFGWLFLGGKCRFCRSKISAEYPLVELLVGLLWVALFVFWYVLPTHTTWLGVDWGAVRPEWAVHDSFDGWPRDTWHVFIALAVLIASLVAMTLVDAKTFTIPLALPWFATIVGILFNTIGGLLVGSFPGFLRTHAHGWAWALPNPGGSDPGSAIGWWWTGASIGGSLGIALSVWFLKMGWLRRSFDDYAQWEDAALKEMREKSGSSVPQIDDAPPARLDVATDEMIAEAGKSLVSERAGAGVSNVLKFTFGWLLTIVVLGTINAFIHRSISIKPWAGLALGAVIGPMVGALMSRVKQTPTQAVDKTSDPSAPELWIAYPHARREMLKEVLFLTPCLALAWLGGWGFAHFAGHTPQLWLVALSSSLMGYLIGAGVIWMIRIFGSLAFGKEAMGLGDVHMMGAVGACIGWIDATLAVPLAAVCGLYWVIISSIRNSPTGRAMPFGPYLAVGTMLVIFGKPLIEMGLNHLLGVMPGDVPVDLP